MITATRYHDISCGHRVVGHEGKCALLHGHNYRIYFTAKMKIGADHGAQLDDVGRVVDFSILKSTLCQWLEDNWDHRTLLWIKDMLMYRQVIKAADEDKELQQFYASSFIWVPFNPTAENIAHYLRTVVGPKLLPLSIVLVSVVVEETMKCKAESYNG